MYAHTLACTNNYEGNFNNVAGILKRETFLPSMADTQSCGKQANFKKKRESETGKNGTGDEFVCRSTCIMWHCLKTNLTYWICSETTLFNKDTFVPCVLRSQEED